MVSAKAEEESGVIEGHDIAFPYRLHRLFCSLKEQERKPRLLS